MVDVVDGGPDDCFWDPPMFDLGGWLRRRRGVMDANECRWLEVLADFERDEAYAYDGQLTAASWLMWATGMARSTAYEKLRMASELSRRPIVKEAFAKGEISYSAARSICSLDGTEPETDAALVNVAKHGSVAEVEAAVRYYQLLASQDVPPYEPQRRDVSSRKGHHGLGQFKATLDNDEIAFIETVIKAFRSCRPEAESQSEAEAEPFESARADTQPGDRDAGTAHPGAFEPQPPDAGESNQSAHAGTDPSGPETGVDDWKIPYGARRADALMEICSVAMAHLGGGQLAGADRYMVHVVADMAGLKGEIEGTAELVEGSVLPEGTLSRLACDASFVGHLLGKGSEPLALGRRVRDWTPAQRRAVRVRDRDRCRFPGCERGMAEIHHIIEWDNGGDTDLSNAASPCGRHHVVVHQKGSRPRATATGSWPSTAPTAAYSAPAQPPTARPPSRRGQVQVARMRWHVLRHDPGPFGL